MEKKFILETIVRKITKKVLIERKTDSLSLFLSRKVIQKFKKGEDFKLYDIYFQRGEDYANFDFECFFVEDSNLEHPFSIDAGADMENMDITITYNPNEFPENMSDLVAEVKETIEHELEHIEQQNFEDKHVSNKTKHQEDNLNLKYLTSNVEIPAYVRGLKKRAKTKKISLEDAMEEWFTENKKKFEENESDWKKVKKIWLDYANNKKIN